jgi:hypothetical protein
VGRELIADTEYYKIEVDTVKNMTISTYHGFWPDTEEFKNGFLDTLRKSLTRVQPGFTSHLDIRDMKVPPQGVMDAILKGHELLKQRGISKAARITDQPIHQIAVNRIGREADMKEDTRMFNTISEAQAWLES